MLVRPRVAVAACLLGLSPALPPHAPAHRSIAPPAERILANPNRAPAGRLRAGVLTLDLELRSGMFRPHADDGPGVEVQAFGERGRALQIPGPLVRVPEGTVIHATIRNRLRDSTLVLHGFAARSGANADSIVVPPGATRRVQFGAGRAGTYYYWGTTTGKRMEDDRWIDSQLSGAFIVDPPGTPPPAGERVFVMGLWLKPPDSASGDPGGEFMVINGKSWPETERLGYTVGDTVHWRWLNPTSSSHPMHLHGFYYEVDSRGSGAADTVYAPDDRRMVVTELMPPGGTMTARWTPTRPGNWLFHCHFAFHIADAQLLSAKAGAAGGHDGAHPTHRMAGLVLGMHVAPAARAAPETPAAGEPTRLRLLVQPARAPADSAYLVGYAL
jgi:manganese oxidase